MSKYQDNRITDFSMGYIDKVDDTQLPAGAVKSWNMISRQIGKIDNRNGQAKLNITELGSPGTGVHYPTQGIHTFYSGTTKYLLVVANGVVYACTPPASTMTPIKTGLDTAAPVMFVNAMIDGVNCVLGFNGVNTPFKWNGVMQAQVETATVSGTVISPVSQAETAVIVGTVTTAGNAYVIITADGMAGSPKTISVTLELNDDAATVAGKIRTALSGDTDVTALFTVGGTDANVTLTKTVAAANDDTLNIAYANDTCAGLTDDTTSDNTTAGVAPGAGNISVVVTAAGMTGSPVTLSVAVANGDNATAVAGKIKTAMAADTGIAAWFAIGGTGANIVLTCKTIAINDATLNVAISTGTAAGIADAPTSENTTAGITVTDMNDYRIVTREEPTTTDFTVYSLAHTNIRTGAAKTFVFSNSTLLDDTDYTVQDAAGTITFPAARVNTVTDLTSDDAQTTAYPEIGRFVSPHPYKDGCTVTVYDKDNNVITPTAVNYVEGSVSFDGGINVDIEVSTPETATPSSDHKNFRALHPFKAGTTPVVKDKNDNTLTPANIVHDLGMVSFTTSQATIEPLKMTYTWVENKSMYDFMPVKVAYQWTDVIEVDYQYSNGNVPVEYRYPVAHNGRVFVCSSASESSIFWSDITENGSEYEAWPPVNNWPIKQGDGDRCTCSVPMLGELYIFKTRSIHRFKGIDLEDFNLKEVEPNVGCAGARAACADGSKIYFVSEQGLYIFNGIEASNISKDRIPLLWDRINKLHIGQAAVHVWHGLVLFALPLDASTVNNIVLVFDTSSGAFWPWSAMSITGWAEIATTSGTKLYSGHSEQGYVIEQDTGTDDYGANILTILELPVFDGGAADTIKKSKYVFVEYGEDQSTWGTVYVSKDNADALALTANNADGKLRKFALKPTIDGKYRYLGITIEHNTADGFVIRSVNVPFKAGSKPKVKGVAS